MPFSKGHPSFVDESNPILLLDPRKLRKEVLKVTVSSNARFGNVFCCICLAGVVFNDELGVNGPLARLTPISALQTCSEEPSHKGAWSINRVPLPAFLSFFFLWTK